MDRFARWSATSTSTHSFSTGGGTTSHPSRDAVDSRGEVERNITKILDRQGVGDPRT
jgi:hypothetical protein